MKMIQIKILVCCYKFYIIHFFVFLENIEVAYLSECLCQKHLATELINRTYTMSVEQLFDCIFGDNDFLVAYRASRRIKGSLNSFSFLFFHNRFFFVLLDFQAPEWQINSESGKRERVCTYKVSVTAVIGSTTICVTERQVRRRKIGAYFSLKIFLIIIGY